jgi:hypothetical protein
MDNLQEAYLSVYQELDEATKAETHKEKKDPSFSRRVARNARYREENPTAGINAQLLRQMAHASKRGVKKEEFDLFDYLLEYLVAEGYADTNENAIAIMANMSEEWKQSIIEAKYEQGMSADEKRRIRTARTGNTDSTPTHKGGHPIADYERRGRHRERDERNKDLADLRKGKKKNSSYFSYLP